MLYPESTILLEHHRAKPQPRAAAARVAPRLQRVLHVVGTMNFGGIESWLMRVLRATDRSQRATDFLVYADGPFDYSREIERLGGRLVRCAAHHNIPRFVMNLRRVLRENGPYDIVHCHVGHYSAVVLAVAKWAGVPVRIAHSHNDFSLQKHYMSLGKRMYWNTAPWAIRASATAMIGCSVDASQSLFGSQIQSDPRHHILRCGVDFASLVQPSTPAERIARRRSLQIPDDARVVGHIGRFSHQKNHAFLLQAFQHVAQFDPRVRLLLIGQGELEATTRQQAQDLAIQDKVIFAGPRNDAAQLMHDVMDIFVLPSHHEGLPVVLLESQGTGTVSLIASNIPTEADLVPGLIHRRTLEDGAEAWATNIISLLNSRDQKPSRQQAVARLCDSEFSLDHCMARLQEISQTDPATGDA